MGKAATGSGATAGARLNNPAPAATDTFGYSVAVSGTVAVVGANRDSPGGVAQAGSAYVFDTATGSLIATLNNPDPTTNDYFDFRVAVSGTTAVVGTNSDDPGGIGDAGTAYVFNTATGSLIATLNNPDPAASDHFGYSVAVLLPPAERLVYRASKQTVCRPTPATLPPRSDRGDVLPRNKRCADRHLQRRRPGPQAHA